MVVTQESLKLAHVKVTVQWKLFLNLYNQYFDTHKRLSHENVVVFFLKVFYNDFSHKVLREVSI